MSPTDAGGVADDGDLDGGHSGGGPTTVPYDRHDPPRPPWLPGRVPAARVGATAKRTTIVLVLAASGVLLAGFLGKLALDAPLFLDITTWDRDVAYGVSLLLLLVASTTRRYAPRRTTGDRQDSGVEGAILNQRVQDVASVALVGLVVLALLVGLLSFLNATVRLPGAAAGTVRLALTVVHHGAFVTAALLVATLLHALLIDFHGPETVGRMRLARLLRVTAFLLIVLALAVNLRLAETVLVLHPTDAVVLYATALTVLVALSFVQGAIESPARPLATLLRRFEDVRTVTVDWSVIAAVVLGGVSLVVVAILVAQGDGARDTPVPVGYSLLFLGIVLAALVFLFVRFLRLGALQQTQIARRRYHADELVRLLLILVSATAATLFAVLGLLRGAGVIGPLRILGFTFGTIDHIAFTAFAAIGPMSFYVYAQKRRTRILEDRFPELLRDLAESRRAGLTLVAALRSAAHGDYGPLTPELHTMARQLSWGVSFDRVLELFADRIRTPLVDRSVSLILEAGKAGGRVTDVLLAAARDAREIRLLGRDRRLQMSSYIMIVYVAALVFLAVVAIMAAMFVPRIVEAGEALGELGETAGLSGSVLPLQEYLFFYFGAAVVQSLGTGLVAGTLEDGQVSSGFRHAFVLLLVSYLTFRLIVL